MWFHRQKSNARKVMPRRKAKHNTPNHDLWTINQKIASRIPPGVCIRSRQSRLSNDKSAIFDSFRDYRNELWGSLSNKTSLQQSQPFHTHTGFNFEYYKKTFGVLPMSHRNKWSEPFTQAYGMLRRTRRNRSRHWRRKKTKRKGGLACYSSLHNEMY